MVLKEAMLIFDYFGISPPIYYKKTLLIKTQIGATISLLFFIFIISITIYFSLEHFQKKYPELNVYKNYQDPNIALNTSNFFFAIVFTDRNGKFINIENESIYFQRKKMVQSNHVINEGNDFRDQETKDDPTVNISFVPCKREYLTDFDNADDEIKEYIVKHGHCFEMNNTFLKGSPMFTTNSTGFRYIFGYDADHYYDYGSLNQIFPLRIQFFISNRSTAIKYVQS